MMPADQFFLMFLATILIIRIFLFFKPTPSPTIRNFRLHHYMYGIVAITIGFLTHSVIIYAIGLGLFIDELTYLIMRGKTHADNYSKKSLLGTLFLIILTFIFRDYLLKLVL